MIGAEDVASATAVETCQIKGYAPWEGQMMDEHGSQPESPEITSEMLNAYGLMLMWLFFATIIFVLVIAVPLSVVFWLESDLPILAFVALSGALGAFISSLSRLYGLKELPALLLQKNLQVIQNRYVALYSLIPPLVGIVAAVVVYVAVVAGLVRGDLFADFKCYAENGDCDFGLGGLLQYGPAAVSDYANVLVWGFISGFSERFFPGVLESLSKQG